MHENSYDPGYLESLLPYCFTDRQVELIAATIKTGSAKKAAELLKLNQRTVTKAITRVRDRAASRGWSPPHDMTHTVPEGYHVKGVSTYYDKEGQARGQWVKSQIDADAYYKMLIEAVEEAFSTAVKIPRIDTPRHSFSEDVLTCYPMGDPHIGMYAWADETGDDFDSVIAERMLIAATTRLVSLAPASKEAFIINVGDFYHSDNLQNRTMRSGNVLDVDTRWAKVLWTGLRTMRACIEACLRKHEKVRVVNEIGNHDDHTSQMLTMALAMLYEQNDRVFFDTSPARFHYHTFGKNLIGVTHGDTVKPEKLGEIMATDRSEDWGSTKYRYWYTGHVHHRRVFELPGCTVESFRTLAGKDAWTAASGYRSGRDMYSVVLHKEWGEIERHRVDAALVESEL